MKYDVRYGPSKISDQSMTFWTDEDLNRFIDTFMRNVYTDGHGTQEDFEGWLLVQAEYMRRLRNSIDKCGYDASKIITKKAIHLAWKLGNANFCVSMILGLFEDSMDMTTLPVRYALEIIKGTGYETS